MGLFIDHTNSVLAKLREAPISSLSTDATSEAYKAQESVRRAVWRIWNAKLWDFKKRSYTYSVTSGTSDIFVQRFIGEIYQITSSVSPYILKPIREDLFNQIEPNPTASGNPEFYRLYEDLGYATAVPSASTLAASSNSSSDTTQKVLIKGIVGGLIDQEELSLSGTSSVFTTKNFTDVISITKSATTAGIITIATSGGTTILTLGTLEKTVRLRRLRLFPSPSSSLTLTMRGYGLPPELTNAYEDSLIPSRWDYVVDQFALAFALQAKGQSQIAEFQAQMSLADAFLNEDMLTEEIISTEEPIVPQRWGGNIEKYGYTSLPSGYGYT